GPPGVADRPVPAARALARHVRVRDGRRALPVPGWAERQLCGPVRRRDALQLIRALDLPARAESTARPRTSPPRIPPPRPRPLPPLCRAPPFPSPPRPRPGPPAARARPVPARPAAPRGARGAGGRGAPPPPGGPRRPASADASSWDAPWIPTALADRARGSVA